MAAAWLSIEYCWCSVDIRRYWATQMVCKPAIRGGHSYFETRGTQEVFRLCLWARPRSSPGTSVCVVRPQFPEMEHGGSQRALRRSRFSLEVVHDKGLRQPYCWKFPNAEQHTDIY